jgi:hypothetical protein
MSDPCPSDVNPMHFPLNVFYPVPVDVEGKKKRFQERIADVLP